MHGKLCVVANALCHDIISCQADIVSMLKLVIHTQPSVASFLAHGLNSSTKLFSRIHHMILSRQ